MNYYKITNENENHNGMQYKTGLNVDILPFNPYGDCEKGGIYFAREDILAFLNYGCWIRQVTIPDGEDVYENPTTNGEPKKWKAHRVILGERRKIDLTVIKELIDEGANIHADDDYALRLASYDGHLDIVEFLVEKGANIHACDDYALQLASKYGHLDIVKFLVDRGADVHADDDYAVRGASGNGHLDIVKFLVEKGANIHACDDYALWLASENGHLAVVKYLKSIMAKENNSL